MKITAVLVLLALASVASAMVLPRPGSGSVTGEVFKTIPGEYIVVLREGISLESVQSVIWVKR